VFVDGQFRLQPAFRRHDHFYPDRLHGLCAVIRRSILHPTLEAVVLGTICPHTLSNRPIAVNSESTIELLLLHANDARVHFDGQRHFDLQENDWGDRAPIQADGALLHPFGHSYYDMLRQKLHWGEKL